MGISKGVCAVYHSEMLYQPVPNQPTAIVIFGGTGNLAETKLLPALFNLYTQKMLPDSFIIIGLSRRSLSHAEYQDFVHESIVAKNANTDEHALTEFCSHIRFSSGSFSDIVSYAQIKDELMRFDATLGQCTSKLFYLAVPPNLYGEIFEKLKESDAMALCDGVDSWSRLLVEKPFGSDLQTAQNLETQLCELFNEKQIYRIDHYLAKDSIESIISLRFANSILADSWNGEKIESITLRLFESQDVSTRGSFYDGIGTLRDVGQNHMLQMLALLTMQPADVHSADAVRASRLNALKSLIMHDTDLRLRGQYAGYRETTGVSPESTTETYFKIETHIDSELWKNVQVTLESGKALNASFTEAVIAFRPIDQCRCAAEPEVHSHRNVLSITFSPEHSIRLTMWVKEPGFEFRLHERELILAKQEAEIYHSPEAYERVLYDCIVGDQTRFVSGDEVLAAWNFITPILESFHTLPLHEYPKGTSSPIIENT
jgi:glucose-6-phosphate 1-dehydrogenase